MSSSTTCSKDRMVSLDAVIQFAIWSERSTAGFYRSLAEGFAHAPMAATFWQEMTRDELLHAAALQRLHQSLLATELSQAADVEMSRAVFRLGRTMIADMSIVTLEHAYQAAHELENSELNALSSHLVAQFAPDIQVRRQHTIDVIKHTMKLVAFSQQFGGPSVRGNITIQFAPLSGCSEPPIPIPRGSH